MFDDVNRSTRMEATNTQISFVPHLKMVTGLKEVTFEWLFFRDNLLFNDILSSLLFYLVLLLRENVSIQSKSETNAITTLDEPWNRDNRKLYVDENIHW